MPTPITVAIIPGFAEGKYLTKHFRQVLAAAGYLVTDNRKNADIVIGHSGGCYLIPKDAHAKTVLHIGYPYWPGRSLRRSTYLKVVDEFKKMPMLRWLRKCVLNDLYIFRLTHTWRIARGYFNRELLLKSLPPGQIFVKNEFDPFCQLGAIRETAGLEHSYISLPGYHDHLWDNPEQYVNLLKSVV